MIPTFKAKLWKSGGSLVLTVPTQYIKDGHIDREQEYEVTLKKEVVQ